MRKSMRDREAIENDCDRDSDRGGRWRTAEHTEELKLEVLLDIREILAEMLVFVRAKA